MAACRKWREELPGEQEKGSIPLQNNNTASQVYKETSKTTEKRKTASEAGDGGKGMKTTRNKQNKQMKTGKKEQSHLSLVRSFEVGTSTLWSLKTMK